MGVFSFAKSFAKERSQDALQGGASAADKFINAKLFIYRVVIPAVLTIPIAVFLALSIAGCVDSSATIRNLYIVELQSAQNTTELASIQVRMGYFGICGIDEIRDSVCKSSRGIDPADLTEQLFPDLFLGNGTSKTSKGLVEEVQDLVSTAVKLQDQVFVTVLFAGAVFFATGLPFLIAYRLAKKRDMDMDSPRWYSVIRKGTYGSLYLSTMLIFAAALGTTETAGALYHATTDLPGDSPILIKEGVTLQVLQWMAFGFSLLFSLAIPFISSPGFSLASRFTNRVMDKVYD